MFKEDNISRILKKKYSNFIAKIYELKSCFYGNEIEDLAAMSLISELLPSNNDMFDINKLKHALNLLYDKTINVTIENKNVIQNGMFKVNQNQVVYIIKKEKNQ